MTPSQTAKSYGFKTMQEVCELTGVPRRTLDNWNYTKPDLFRVVLLGATVKDVLASKHPKHPKIRKYFEDKEDG